MREYSQAAVERAMKIQEVILRAMAGKLRWWQAAEIIGMTDRSLRRWRWQQYGYDGLFDRRRGKPSPKRVPGKLRKFGQRPPPQTYHRCQCIIGLGSDAIRKRKAGRHQADGISATKQAGNPSHVNAGCAQVQLL